jgi:hypothetical protein
MRIDRYDVIGLALLAVVAAVWILHFALPAPPPEPDAAQGLPGPALPGPALPGPALPGPALPGPALPQGGLRPQP